MFDDGEGRVRRWVRFVRKEDMLVVWAWGLDGGMVVFCIERRGGWVLGMGRCWDSRSGVVGAVVGKGGVGLDGVLGGVV